MSEKVSSYSDLSGVQAKFGHSLPEVDGVRGCIEVLEVQTRQVRARLRTRDASMPLVIRNPDLLTAVALPRTVGAKMMVSVSGRAWVTTSSQIELMVDQMHALPD